MNAASLLLPLLLPLIGVPITILFRKQRRLQSTIAFLLMLTALGFTINLLRIVLTTGL